MTRNVRWYMGGIVAAIAVGWIAARLHLAGMAPIGIVSIAIGVVLGAVLAGLSALLAVTCRTRLLVGTIIFALVTVFATHAWLYVDFRRQWHAARANSAEVALFRPETPWSPAEYFARELSPSGASLWTLDATLIVASSAGVVWVWPRQRK